MGDSAINVSEYIKDARAMALPLLGGDSSGHDWHWMLSTLNLLPQDLMIGNVVWSWGSICILASIGIGLYLIIFDYIKLAYSE